MRWAAGTFVGPPGNPGSETAAAALVVAAALRAAADALVPALDAVGAGAGPSTWQGPAALRFAGRLVGHRSAVERAATDLRLLAADHEQLAADAAAVHPAGWRT